MKPLYLLLPIFLLVQLQLMANSIRGFVRNELGQPMAFVAVYVSETGTGGITNEQGFYEIRLEPGDYTIIFQYLGYKTLTEKMSLGSLSKELSVQMQPQAFELKEITVYDGEEDGAYTVMRRAIAKADYHRQQVESYSARVYVKGSGRVINVPFFLRSQLAEAGLDSTTAFTSESVSIVEYERPNTLREKVISVYQQGEDFDTSPIPYINESFYQPTVVDAVSPLSPKAFTYYRFELAGYFQDRGYGVNKIKVTPRSRGDNVFEGYIYILENDWSIHSLELSAWKQGIQFKMKQSYEPIQAKAWMPVSARFDVTGRIMGISFEFKYLASLSNYQITLNNALPSTITVIDERQQPEISRQVQQQRKQTAGASASAAEKLAAGEEVSSKELRQLMREYAREEVQKQDAPEVVENRSFTVDSLAANRDSAFWAEIRPLPLTEQEARGYVKLDSLAKVEREKEEAEADSVSITRFVDGKFNAVDLLLGDTWKLGERRYFEYKSALSDIQFNPVEGFNATASFRYRQGGDRPWSVGFVPRYGFSWRRFNFKTDGQWSFGPANKQQSFKIEGGRFISQFNDQNPIAEIFNTYYALWSELNYLQLYEKEYGAFSWNGRRTERIKWTLSGEWAHRRYVENTTTQTWNNRREGTYSPNTPVHRDWPEGLPARERAFVVAASAEFSPWLKYRTRNGKQEVIDNSSPVISLLYRKGIPNVAQSVTDFDHLDIGIRQRLRVGAAGTLDYRLHMGGFLRDDYLGFPDYKHFPGNQITLVSADPVASFRLLPYYEFSTNSTYLQAHLHHQFRKLMLTQIWQVQLMGIKENAFINHLYTADGGHFTELGYGIDNILRFLRLEGAFAFRDGQYYDWGIRISISSAFGGGIIQIE
jgi:hypothetical protein